MFKVQRCLNVRGRRFTAGGSSQWNIFHCHYLLKRERLITLCSYGSRGVTYCVQVSCCDRRWRWFHPPLPQHQFKKLNAIWILLQCHTWKHMVGFRAKEGVKSGDQNLTVGISSGNESAVQNGERTYSRGLHFRVCNHLFPHVTSDRLPQVLLQDVSFGCVSTWGLGSWGPGARLLVEWLQVSQREK